MIEIETDCEEVETPMIEAPATAPQLRCTKSASVLKAGALPQTPKVGALAETSDQSELKKTRTCVVCGAAFVPSSGSQITCSAACAAKRHNLERATIKSIRDQQRKAEKRERAAREARLKRRDAAYAANAPRTKVVTRGKIKVELRGTVPVAPRQPPSELRVQRPAGFGWSHF